MHPITEISDIIDGLNAAQREAVTSSARILRVIAGAGSGKTKVLVQRMIWWMYAEHMQPTALMALTFTNKAAREMRARLEEALQKPMGIVRMGTFHHVCGRILRQHAERMHWSRDFVVMDTDDQQRMIKRLMRDRQIDIDGYGPKELANLFNALKEEGIRADAMDIQHNRDLLIQELYRDYQTACIQQGRMDFAEMLLLAVELLQQHPDIRRAMHQRYSGILVDEFQDTNGLQFQFIELMLGPDTKLFVVGDDDQSIYSWRGARVENILSLEEYFPETETIRLEQNYRSTGTILNAANAVIAHNRRRLGKNLWTDGNTGELIQIYPAVSEYEEADWLAASIGRHIDAGGSYSDCAVLYRNNALSRVIEGIFLEQNIPYRVTGGLRFFERAEIKDALAYLRTAIYPQDDSALERIINRPARSIGEKTIADIRSLARQGGLPLWSILTNPELLRRHFSARAFNALTGFVSLIQSLQAKINANPSLEQALIAVCEDTGLMAQFTGKDSDDHESRIENLHALIAGGRHREHEAARDGITGLQLITDFLSDAALDAGDTEAGEGQDAVQLMTLHTAKGLEFPHVFIIAVEEDIFPSSRSTGSEETLQEERRLAYVGITRAKKQLHLSFAQRRRYHGKDTYPDPSRFIHEIPEEYTDKIRPLPYSLRMQNSRSSQEAAISEGAGGYKQGDIVEHKKYGEGCIMSFEGTGDNLRALVRFSSGEEKWLILQYANLEVKGRLL